MEISSHPSADELGETLREMDVTLACTVCGQEEFSVQEDTLRGSGKGQTTGPTAWRVLSSSVRSAGTSWASRSRSSRRARVSSPHSSRVIQLWQWVAGD